MNKLLKLNKISQMQYLEDCENHKITLYFVK